MKLGFFILFFVLFATGCSTLPKGYKLAKFYYNGKPANSCIMSRKPDYGNGNLDGCVIMQEMSLALVNSGQTVISGMIKNVSSSKVVKGASITISFLDEIQPLRFASDSNGNFEFTKNQKIDFISINSPGYRPLIIKLTGKKLLK